MPFRCPSYCGHGNGREFLRGDSIQRINCKALTFLIGCSSGKLQVWSCISNAHSTPMLIYYLFLKSILKNSIWDCLKTIWLLVNDHSRLFLCEAEQMYCLVWNKLSEFVLNLSMTHLLDHATANLKKCSPKETSRMNTDFWFPIYNSLFSFLLMIVSDAVAVTNASWKAFNCFVIFLV